MREELQQKLYDDYPKIFANSKLPYNKSILSWYGIECEDGWYQLIHNMCWYIQHTIDIKNIQQVVATQIKEKFGYLSFYHVGGNNITEVMISQNEQMSFYICEYCGTTLNVGHTNEWIKTICKECYDKSKNKMEWEPIKTHYGTKIDMNTELARDKSDYIKIIKEGE